MAPTEAGGLGRRAGTVLMPCVCCAWSSREGVCRPQQRGSDGGKEARTRDGGVRGMRLWERRGSSKGKGDHGAAGGAPLRQTRCPMVCALPRRGSRPRRRGGRAGVPPSAHFSHPLPSQFPALPVCLQWHHAAFTRDPQRCPLSRSGVSAWRGPRPPPRGRRPPPRRRSSALAGSPPPAAQPPRTPPA